MSDTATLLPEAPPPALAADASRAMAERRLAILGRVAEVGLEIIEALKAQAKGGPVVVQGDLVLAFDRAARAVRHTFMLQERLEEAMQEREAGEAGRKAALKASAARIVRGAIEDEETLDANGAKRVAAEAAERLRAEDIGDLFSRPFGEAVAGICRDLGLSPDWLELAEACYAAEAAAAGKPGSAPETSEDDWDGRYEVKWLSSSRSTDSS